MEIPTCPGGGCVPHSFILGGEAVPPPLCCGGILCWDILHSQPFIFCGNRLLGGPRQGGHVLHLFETSEHAWPQSRQCLIVLAFIIAGKSGGSDQTDNLFVCVYSVSIVSEESCCWHIPHSNPFCCRGMKRRVRQWHCVTDDRHPSNDLCTP